MALLGCHPAKAALSDANIAIVSGTWTPGYALCGRTRLLLRTTRRSTQGSTDIVQSCRRSGDGLRASDRGLLARDVAHNLPRLGTLTMRLSIDNAPATARAISSAGWRKPPLQLMPSSVTFSSVTDTETPSGAIDRLMCSANADLIRTSMSLLARRSALRHDRASGSFRRVRRWYSRRSRASLTPKPSLGPLHPTTLAA